MWPAVWLTWVAISGGLCPPPTLALNIDLRFRALSMAPECSRLLSCLPPTKRTHEGLVFFTALTRVSPRMWLSCRFLYCLSLFQIFGNCWWGTILYHRGAARRGYTTSGAAAMQSLPPAKSCLSFSFVYIPPASFQSREQQAYLHQFELIYQLSYCITSTPFAAPFAFFIFKGLNFA